MAADVDRVRDRDRLMRERVLAANRPRVLTSIRRGLERIGRAVRRG
jgi:hypothetical protein